MLGLFGYDKRNDAGAAAQFILIYSKPIFDEPL
jgi:hypothetical protein